MKGIVIFLLGIMIHGCTGKKLMVENADTLLSYQISKRIPLYSKEKEKLEKEIEKFLNDSKPEAQEVLPVIDEIDLQKPDKIEGQYKKLEMFYMQLSRDFSAILSSYIARMDQKQRASFFETLDDENREILKKDKEARIDDFEDRFEIFFGKINGPQKQIIREYSDFFEDRARQRLNRRVKLHETLRVVLKQDLSVESKERLIKEAFSDYQVDASKGNKNLEIMNKFIPTITDGQKSHFREQIKEIKELLKYFISIDY